MELWRHSCKVANWYHCSIQPINQAITEVTQFSLSTQQQNRSKWKFHISGFKRKGKPKLPEALVQFDFLQQLV
uniref:Uncharacterized protein n=1 Tax=Arundo donax TaxID=35708 RepID=A0A0A9H3I1_ARUDO